MKRLFWVLFALTFSYKAFCQTEAETIKKANDLIADKKYESAFKVLQEFDPKNSNPDVVLLKEDIVLNYFVTSIMHQMFALKDLEKNEDIIDYRGQTGSFGMYVFEPDSILKILIKKYPEDYRLPRGLADFYYEVYHKYSGNWLKSDQVLLNLIQKNYQVVIDHNLADDQVYYRDAYILLRQKRNKEAIPYFLKSIELKKDVADAHYNLAYAYLFLDDRDNAIKYAKNAINLYKEADLKSDAARMVAQAYIELKDDKNALTYYEMANTIDTGNYENIKPLLNLYVKTGNSKKSETLNLFYELAPEKPTIYNDLYDIYDEYQKTDELIKFYTSKLPIYAEKKQIEGSLYFYLGKLYLDSDKKEAKKYFLEAKNIFASVYEKDHAVFKEIEKGIKEAEEK